MNSQKMHRIKGTAYDLILASLMFLFIVLAVMSPTIGNTGFYSKYLSSGEVTTKLQTTINEKMEDVARLTGIEEQAFKYAVGEKKISSTQKEMMRAAFAGTNYDYSSSANIETCYREGIREFYRSNGMSEELNEKDLETAVTMACKVFNSSLGIDNNKEFKTFTYRMSKLSIVLTIGLLILIVVLAFRVYTFSHGRTTVFSHYGSSLISSGLALVLLFVVNMLLGISDKLYLTNNEGINYAMASAFNVYFFILGVFGAAFIVGGASLITYVYNYYTKKMQKQRQEININKSLLVSAEDGDVTIGEIVESRRKAKQEQHRKD